MTFDAFLATERALARLCDPDDAWAATFMPTPYMDLPAFIDGAKDVLDKQQPPDVVRDRLVAAIDLATKMLAEGMR